MPNIDCNTSETDLTTAVYVSAGHTSNAEEISFADLGNQKRDVGSVLVNQAETVEESTSIVRSFNYFWK
jgi:hypothetical protein